MLTRKKHILEIARAVGSVSACRSKGHEFEPQPSQITLVEVHHERISMALLYFSLIQEGQLSVTGENH